MVKRARAGGGSGGGREDRWFARLGRRLRRGEPLTGMVLGSLVGLLGGIAAVLFTALIEWVQGLALGSSLPAVPALAQVAWYWRVAIPAIGGLLVAPIVYRWAAEARGHGVPEVIEAVAVHAGNIRPRVAVAKSVGSAITIGTGGSVGREGPVVQTGAALGSLLAQLLELPREQRRNLVGCGAAAGIAATFNAPIAAAFFAFEVILGNFAIATFGPIVLASVVATAVSRAHFGAAPAFTVPEYELTSWWELTSYAGLGLLCGALGCAFTWTLYRLEDVFEGSHLPKLLRPAAAGLLLGIAIVALPELYGSGFESIEAVLHGRETWAVALVLVAAKLLAASLTLASGGSGGVFSPSLFVGAVAGYAAGHAVGLVAPFPTGPPGAYALVGMGAVLGGATHAPITSMLMLFELTGDYNIILPVMLATTASTFTARGLMRGSIYTVKLQRKGIHVRAGREEAVMTGYCVRDVMRPEVPAVELDAPFPEVMAKFLSAPITELYVVDERQRLLGTISLHDIKELIGDRSLDPLLVAHDLMVPRPHAVLADDTLAESTRRFAETGVESLPVIADPHTRRLIGVVTERDLFDLYDREVLRRELLGTYAASDRRLRRFPLPAGQRLRSLSVPQGWVGSTLQELDLRRRTGVTVIAIQHHGDRLTADSPDPDRPLAAGDVLVLLESPEGSAALDMLAAEGEKGADKQG